MVRLVSRFTGITDRSGGMVDGCSCVAVDAERISARYREGGVLFGEPGGGMGEWQGVDVGWRSCVEGWLYGFHVLLYLELFSPSVLEK